MTPQRTSAVCGAALAVVAAWLAVFSATAASGQSAVGATPAATATGTGIGASAPGPAPAPAAPPAGAARSGAWPEQLTGSLQRIKARRTVKVGYRADAIPFSYLGPDGRPIGYTLELCAVIGSALADELGVPVAIEYVPVTALDRFEQVGSGRVDLECGSTTNDALRRRAVAFSPTIFVTGTRLAVPKNSPHAKRLRDLRGLADRSIAVVAGTTAEAALRELDRRRSLGIRLVAATDYRDALASVAEGRADALAGDEVLLLGLLAETGRQADYRLVGQRLSVEAYGIMFARDDAALAGVVEATLRRLAESREIAWIYNRWFVRPLPGRGALGLPMSPELRRALELIGLPSS